MDLQCALCTSEIMYHPADNKISYEMDDLPMLKRNQLFSFWWKTKTKRNFVFANVNIFAKNVTNFFYRKFSRKCENGAFVLKLPSAIVPLCSYWIVCIKHLGCSFHNSFFIYKNITISFPQDIDCNVFSWKNMDYN